jgi:hypothetical protein
MIRNQTNTTGRPKRAATVIANQDSTAATVGLAASPRARMGPATPTPPNPLDAVLRNAADRAADPAVKRWLRALLHHGEAACGGGEVSPRPKGTEGI